MSLIDVRHLAAPFRQVNYVILIAVTAFLFLLWRWGGSTEELRAPRGAVMPTSSFMPSSSERAMPSGSALSGTGLSGTGATGATPSVRAPGRRAEDDNVLADFVARTEGQTPTPRSGSGSALEDIERQLGLK